MPFASQTSSIPVMVSTATSLHSAARPGLRPAPVAGTTSAPPKRFRGRPGFPPADDVLPDVTGISSLRHATVIPPRAACSGIVGFATTGASAMKRVMIVLAATTALTAAAAAQDRGGEFGRGPMRDQFARDDGRGDFGGGPAMGRGMGGMGGGMGMKGRFSPEDIEAFTDARIAALHAGLRLSPDQQQMWPPVEQAIRDLVKLRREQFRAWRERREQGGDPRDDLPGMLRGVAERQAVRAEALRKLAEAAAPLYASFDDGQKRRLRMLVRHMRPGGGMMRHAWRGMGRGGMDRGGMDGGGMGRGDMDRGDMGDRWRGRGGMGERGFGFGEGDRR